MLNRIFVQNNKHFILLLLFSVFIVFPGNSYSTDMCTTAPTCTGMQLTECSGCQTPNNFCCPTTGGCASSPQDACTFTPCDVNTICEMPDECTEPMPVQSCTQEQIDNDQECKGCSQTNPFCCPATGGCGSDFSGLCNGTNCTKDNICKVPPPPPAVLKRDIKFVNYCGQEIWVGASTNQLKGGWEMPESCVTKNDCKVTCNDAMTAGAESCDYFCLLGKCRADITIKIQESDGNISGRFWPMTGCEFNNSDECPSGRCCDTGSCTISGGSFGLQCNSTGDSPSTVAEFTLQTGINNDFYDISMIDGYNVPVEMKPSGTPASAPANFNTSYWCGNPGGVVSAVIPSTCNWDTTLGEDCGGKPEFRTVGSLETCTGDSDCNMGNGICNVSSGVCECSADSDCTTGNICGVPNPGITGIKACGTLSGCTTAKDICGLYFGQSVGGSSCGQDALCASNICETNPPQVCSTSSECNNNSQCITNFCKNDPSTSCTMDSECGSSTCVTTKSCTNDPDKSCSVDTNCNVAVCNEGECQCIPNLCVGTTGSKTCTNDGISCTEDSECSPTCGGQCTEGPADFLDCNNLVSSSNSCSADSDCPALVGLPPCTQDSDCPTNTTCVNFGAKPRPGQPAIAKVCRQTCINNLCTGPTCSADSDCTDPSLSGTFMQCDTATNQCVSSYAALFEGAGLSGQSCYIDYYDSQVVPSGWCNGCPTKFNMQASNPNWPTPATPCLNSNSDWVTVVEPDIEQFKKSCPSAYSFPFDDPTSTFQCTNDSQSNSMSYEITFCPGDAPPPPPIPVIPTLGDDGTDGSGTDGDDDDDLPNPVDFENFLAGNSLFVMTGPQQIGPAEPGSTVQLNVTGQSIDNGNSSNMFSSISSRELNNVKIEIIPEQGTAITNAFLEPGIGNCVPGVLGNEKIYTCTIPTLENSGSFDLITDIMINEDKTDTDTLKEIKIMVISDEFEETLNLLVNLIVTRTDETDNTGCTLSQNRNAGINGNAILLMLPLIIIFRMFIRKNKHINNT